MENKGLPENLVLGELESRLSNDFTYGSGGIIGSMCTCPHPLARKIYARYLDRNLGDSGLFPAVVKLERETICTLGKLLSNPKPSGHIVTGGTEANTLAMWAAKKLSRNKNPEVVMPFSAHYSFDRAADLLGLKIVRVGLNSKYQVDVNAVEKAVNSDTIAIVGVAGTTSLGVVDPIAKLSDIATEKDVYLHVDAAFGGFVLPFLKEIGFDVPDFDFSLPGVCSITIDPHKMGLAPIPAGGILFRNESLRTAIAWNVSYLAGGKTQQTTFVGTRSGASVIAVWALLKHLGKESYKSIVDRCMQLTLKLARGVSEIEGLNIVTEPTMNIVGVRSETCNISRIARELRLRRWAVSLFPNHIRIVIMPHVQKQHIENFLNDLKAIINKLRG